MGIFAEEPNKEPLIQIVFAFLFGIGLKGTLSCQILLNLNGIQKIPSYQYQQRTPFYLGKQEDSRGDYYQIIGLNMKPLSRL